MGVHIHLRIFVILGTYRKREVHKVLIRMGDLEMLSIDSLKDQYNDHVRVYMTHTLAYLLIFRQTLDRQMAQASHSP
jgi:hypothetical protein